MDSSNGVVMKILMKMDKCTETLKASSTVPAVQKDLTTMTFMLLRLMTSLVLCGTLLQSPSKLFAYCDAFVNNLHLQKCVGYRWKRRWFDNYMGEGAHLLTDPQIYCALQAMCALIPISFSMPCTQNKAINMIIRSSLLRVMTKRSEWAFASY